jgi:hypothetical protein
MDFSQTFKIAGSILGAYGQMTTASATSAQLLMQANAMDYNAEVSRFMGRQALEASMSQQLAQRRGARKVLGRQRAAIAQAGIGTGGSAADVVAESATLAELDAMNIAFEGAARFRAALTQADFDEANALSYRYGASAAKRAGRLGAARSLLSGAASIWGKG